MVWCLCADVRRRAAFSGVFFGPCGCRMQPGDSKLHGEIIFLWKMAVPPGGGAEWVMVAF